MPNVLNKILFFCCCLMAMQALGNTRNQLFDTDGVIRLNQDTRILWENEGEPLVLEQVLPRLDEFTWPISNNPNFGFSEKGLWFLNRFSNVSEIDEWVVDIGFAQNEKVDFYLLLGDELLAQSSQGKSRLNQDYRFPTFKVSLPYAQDLVLLVRIESPNQSLVSPIDLQSIKSHTKSTLIDDVLWGGFYGGLLMLLIYNIVLYTSTREQSLITYILYVTSVILWQFNWGGHIQLVMDNGFSRWLGEHTDLMFLVVGICAGAFTITFLNAKQTAPKSYLILMPMMGLLVLLSLTSFFHVFSIQIQNILVYMVSMLASVCFLLAGFESYLNRFRPARYFVVAWSLLTSCAIIGLLGLVNVLPSTGFTTYCFQVGVFFEAAIFSIALIDKTRHQLEQEVTTATNDLTNNLELIEEQNVRLELARKDAVKASKIKTQFLANMSHEIRTPLNAILGFSQELAKVHLPHEQQEHVHIINTSASNLLAIVNDVLDFSKIEAGKLTLTDAPFNLNDILEELVYINAKTAGKKNVSFIFESDQIPAKLLGDGVRIKQVLMNLLSNAVKFTIQGHIFLKVTCKSIREELVELQFRVEDTGIGISEMDKEKLFNAFSQIDDALTRSYQGTGLGLVICQQLISLMRGQIHFSSEHGRGSCFQVTIPCYQISHNMQPGPLSDWQDKKVAILNRMPDTRRSLASMFCNVGADVVSIDSLQFLREQYDQFDFLFVDFSCFNAGSMDKLKRSIKRFPADCKVLLQDGTIWNRSSDLTDLFDRKLETPVLYTKLSKFFESEQTESPDIFQQRLNDLPAVNILAVDDMEINLRLLRTWLDGSPLNLTLCFNGADAVDLCRQNEFDLILMDVQMPVMDGLEATKLIRKTELNGGTPIIAVTAHAFKEEQDRLMQSGMDDYLSKPLEMAALINLIKRWCAVPEDIEQTISDTDWQLAKSRANQNEALAQEMFDAFKEQLPGIHAEISNAYHAQDWELLAQLIHKLHGASCYTGVPRLQSLCAEIESHLKANDHESVHQKMPEFFASVDAILAHDTGLAVSH